MSGQCEYEADLLTLQEEINFDEPTNYNEQHEEVNVNPVVGPILRLTRHTMPTLKEPAIINGKPVNNLKHLRPTTTLAELKMREANSYQRFDTREGAILYLERDAINKIDFVGCLKRKWAKTINLTHEFQAKLRVFKDGRILFLKYHRRGQSKINSVHPY